jgi:hypothetical protein
MLTNNFLVGSIKFHSKKLSLNKKMASFNVMALLQIFNVNIDYVAAVQIA